MSCPNDLVINFTSLPSDIQDKLELAYGFHYGAADLVRSLHSKLSVQTIASLVLLHESLDERIANQNE